LLVAAKRIDSAFKDVVKTLTAKPKTMQDVDPYYANDTPHSLAHRLERLQ
jgi:hypothetical protein